MRAVSLWMRMLMSLVVRVSVAGSPARIVFLKSASFPRVAFTCSGVPGFAWEFFTLVAGELTDVTILLDPGPQATKDDTPEDDNARDEDRAPRRWRIARVIALLMFGVVAGRGVGFRIFSRFGHYRASIDGSGGIQI